jgi:hypothetical protein
MPILFFLFSLVAPRLIIAILWFFNWFNGMFDGWIIPLLGFVFTPYTLLWYSAVHAFFEGQWGFWQIIFLVVALLLDLSQLRGRR